MSRSISNIFGEKGTKLTIEGGCGLLCKDFDRTGYISATRPLSQPQTWNKMVIKNKTTYVFPHLGTKTYTTSAYKLILMLSASVLISPKWTMFSIINFPVFIFVVICSLNTYWPMDCLIVLF